MKKCQTKNQKIHHTVKISLLTFIVMSMSACSPFGNQSLIQDIADQVAVFLPGKTSTGLVSSASSTLTTPDPSNGPSGSQPYTVTQSIGDTFQQGSAVSQTMQTSAVTAGGYKVFSSVSSEIK